MQSAVYVGEESEVRARVDAPAPSTPPPHPPRARSPPPSVPLPTPFASRLTRPRPIHPSIHPSSRSLERAQESEDEDSWLHDAPETAARPTEEDLRALASPIATPRDTPPASPKRSDDATRPILPEDLASEGLDAAAPGPGPGASSDATTLAALAQTLTLNPNPTTTTRVDVAPPPPRSATQKKFASKLVVVAARRAARVELAKARESADNYMTQTGVLLQESSQHVQEIDNAQRRLHANLWELSSCAADKPWGRVGKGVSVPPEIRARHDDRG